MPDVHWLEIPCSWGRGDVDIEDNESLEQVSLGFQEGFFPNRGES